MQNSERRPGCPGGESIVTYLRDEMTRDERTSFENHLAECDDCREEVAAFSETLAVLADVPDESTGDMVDGIMARIPEKEWALRKSSPNKRIWRILFEATTAAAVLVALVAGWHLIPSSEPVPPQSASVESALDWLKATQEADGSWSPERWGGQKDYRVALTGLALLAFAGDDDELKQNRHMDTVARARDYLLSQQGKSGRFGPFFNGAPYNHGIATVALLETYALTKSSDLRQPVARALNFIKSQQNPQGGWGYVGRKSPTNTSITTWQLHAIVLTESLGWGRESHDVRQKGLDWLASVVDANGQAGYTRPGDFPKGPETLTATTSFCLSVGPRAADARDSKNRPRIIRSLVQAAGKPTDKIDYYRRYFMTHALRATETGSAREKSRIDKLADKLNTELASVQVHDGPNSGSWEPSDQWGAAGGRVYSTAMAALSLQSDKRTKTLVARLEQSRR